MIHLNASEVLDTTEWILHTAFLAATASDKTAQI